MPLDPKIAELLQLVEASDLPPISDGTVEQARGGLRALMVDMRDPATLVEVASVEDAVVADRVPVRVFRPAGVTGPAPTVVFLHGGGFVIGDLDTHEAVCRMLCRDTGAVVVSVDYRLAPEHPYPAAVQDCWTALEWVAAHVDEFGGDTARVAVAGDSAGGNLAAVCAIKARDTGLTLAAQLLVYPAVDFAGDYPSRTENAEGYFLTLADTIWFAQHYLGLTTDDPTTAPETLDPDVSPLHATSLAGLAPAVIATAEYDPLRDEGEAYADALRAAGVRVESRRFDGLIHGFYGMESISPAAADASAWIDKMLADLLH